MQKQSYIDITTRDIKDLDKNLKSNNTVNFSDFQNTFSTVLHKHAPVMKKPLDLIIVLSCAKPSEKQLCIDQY